MTNPFFDPAERRVRSLWRLLLHLFLFGFFNVGLSFALMTAAASSNGLGIDLTDPNWVQSALAQMTNTPILYALVILSGVLASVAALAVAGRILDRRRLADFGFHFNRGWWLDFAFGLGLGALLMVVIFLVELAAGWVTVTGFFNVTSAWPFAVVTGLALLNFIAVGINEEILSRGYQLRNMAEGLRLWRFSPKTALLIGYILSSSVFGLLHLGNPNTTWISTVNLVIAGLFLGLGYVLTGELAIPIGLHITWNFFQGRVFGFPVSGLATNSTFIAIEQRGPDAWTGGAFGPEAGLIGLLAIGLGCWLTVLWVRWRRGRAELHARLADYQPPAQVHPFEVIEKTPAG